MLFSGNNFRLTPETDSLKFVFDNLLLDTSTGSAEIGFSGTGNDFKFRFVNRDIYSPLGKKVGHFNPNEHFSISGLINTGVYRFYINDDLIISSGSKNNYNIQRFVVNTTGCNLNVDAKLYTSNPKTGIIMPATTKALSGVTGAITNGGYKFRVFDSSLFFYQSNDVYLTGKISGDVNTSSILNFKLTDLDTSRFDSEYSFRLILNTSIGEHHEIFTLNRVSGLSDIVKTLTANSDNLNFAVEFFGSGLANRFIYTPPDNQSQFLTYAAFAENLSGISQPKTLDIKVEQISPAQNSFYKAEYLTGINISALGEYATCPDCQFSGYYYVTGLDWMPSSLLLSKGCTGNLPIRFVSNGGFGAGATGTLAVKKLRLSGVYGNYIEDFYIANGVTILNGGTGYTFPPLATLTTGIYSNCFDVAAISGTKAIYSPFKPSGQLSPLADYMSGITLCTTGLVSGGLATGYLVTGIEITNVGSGFNKDYFPRLGFIRQNGDTLTKNATGVGLMKLSGQYLFDNHWSIQTGISSYEFKRLSGANLPYSGKVYLDSVQNFLTVQVNYSGQDNTEPIVIKITATNEDGGSVYNLVSGVKTYNTSGDFLKKKNLDNYIYHAPQSELSFLLSNDELDTFYNSPEFSINDGLDLGDLDF